MDHARSLRFHVCLHDATPRFERETHAVMRDLAPLVGRRLSLGVVPDWHGRWPLEAHRDYCQFLADSSEERLLHGYYHERLHGGGTMALLTGRRNEMNGLTPGETRRLIERGQGVFVKVFGARAPGFLAPGWQRGHVRMNAGHVPGLDYMLGFFSLQSATGRAVPLTTLAWECGRWRWLGNVGQAVGRVLQLQGGRVPVLALHPRDVRRGYWPTVVQLTRSLLDRGYEPTTLAGLLDVSRSETVS